LAGAKPTPVHNNCSGKHAGMLAVARHLGEPTRGYVRPDHPVQRRIAQIIQDLTGAVASPEVCAVDGCSVPTWALPLAAWARAFAKMVGDAKPETDEIVAGRRLVAACMAEPGYVAGEKRFCTEVMAATSGALFVKTGAEGVFCGALPGRGIGIAIKIDDGATRASEAAMAGLLALLVPGYEDLFGRWSAKPIRSVAGVVVGNVRLDAACLAACRELGESC